MANYDNRVYYGEYTLKHWIELILSGNIQLPEYQRHFVWQERDIKRLIKSLKEKQFVQPVTIALYNVAGNKRNLILDGQQRLTSILLSYLGYIPDRLKFQKGENPLYASEDDSARDEEGNEDGNNDNKPILWKFSELFLGDENDKESIVGRIKNDSRYIQLKDAELIGLSEEFFENTFMGFSYIVPDSSDEDEIQDMFSKLFRNINYFGKKLDALESRKSLYFQNRDLVNFFDGKTDDNKDVLCDIKIMENLQPYTIDFVRYLSILSQYLATNEYEKNVLVGYSAFGSRESYYADYVSYILGQGPEEQESRPEKFSNFNFANAFPNNCWHERFNTLRKSIEQLCNSMGLNDKKAFRTWFEADYWLFGLIYYIVFKGKALKELNEDLSIKDSVRTSSLKEEINKEIQERRDDVHYTRNINRLTQLRQRLKDSCKIYGNYVQ